MDGLRESVGDADGLREREPDDVAETDAVLLFEAMLEIDASTSVGVIEFVTVRDGVTVEVFVRDMDGVGVLVLERLGV